MKWIRPQTLNLEVTGSNLLAAAEVGYPWARHIILSGVARI